MAEQNEKKKKIREPKEVVVVKNTYDYQRMKLDRLMKNPVRAEHIFVGLWNSNSDHRLFAYSRINQFSYLKELKKRKVQTLLILFEMLWDQVLVLEVENFMFIVTFVEENTQGRSIFR